MKKRGRLGGEGDEPGLMQYTYPGEAEKLKSPFYDEFDIWLLRILAASGAIHGYLNAKGLPVIDDPVLLGALYNPALFRVYTGARMGIKAADGLEKVVEKTPEQEELLALPRKNRRLGAGAIFGIGSLIDSGLFTGLGYAAGYVCGAYFF